jgi:hypothetical protein
MSVIGSVFELHDDLADLCLRMHRKHAQFHMAKHAADDHIANFAFRIARHDVDGFTATYFQISFTRRRAS